MFVVAVGEIGLKFPSHPWFLCPFLSLDFSVLESGSCYLFHCNPLLYWSSVCDGKVWGKGSTV